MMSEEDHQVAVAVVLAEDEVLLCHRHPARRWYPNVWDLPGGHIEPTESSREAVIRELAEELGINAQIEDVKPAKVVEIPGVVLHVWRVTSWLGEPENKAPDEHDELRWVRLEDLGDLELAHESLPSVIRSVSQRTIDNGHASLLRDSVDGTAGA